MKELDLEQKENIAKVQADTVEEKAPVPTAAKAIKDIDAILRETRVMLVVTMAEGGSPYTSEARAIVQDIEYLKRVREALK